MRREKCAWLPANGWWQDTDSVTATSCGIRSHVARDSPMFWLYGSSVIVWMMLMVVVMMMRW